MTESVNEPKTLQAALKVIEEMKESYLFLQSFSRFESTEAFDKYKKLHKELERVSQENERLAMELKAAKATLEMAATSGGFWAATCRQAEAERDQALLPGKAVE